MVLYWLLPPECLHKRDSYPLPRIQEALESLIGAGHFSCWDLKFGFWQIKMEEVLKQYTAFTVGNLGFFKCDCKPFGLCNALATFQWLMQNCLGELNLIYCLIYLGDLIVILQTAKEYLHQLHIMFDRLREYNLKLKPLKCSLFKEEIKYLAHWVSKWGVWCEGAERDVGARWYVVVIDSISNDPMLLLLDNSDSPSIVEQ